MKARIVAAVVAVFIWTASGTIGYGQGYLDQEGMVTLGETQEGPAENVKKVEWRVYEYKDHIKGDNKGAWSEFLAYIDTIPGSYHDKRRLIIEIANRVTAENFKIGSKLLIPTSFPIDFRSYAPYPLQYEAAITLPKLFLVDKYTQTFAAYEYGKLVRWGLVCTGHEDDLTPAGRYNFNWKAEYKQSSEAPEGQVWEMYWVFNIDAKAGIHVHQYALPISHPSSHGCIRMSMGDAKWNYTWADGWTIQNGRIVKKGTPVVIFNSNPVSGNAYQWNVEDEDHITSAVNLPDDLLSIPAATDQRVAAGKTRW